MDDPTTPTSELTRAVTGCDDEFFSTERALETEIGYDITLITAVVAVSQT